MFCVVSLQGSPIDSEDPEVKATMIQPKESTNGVKSKPPSKKYEALPTHDSTSPLHARAFGGSKDFQFIDEASDDDALLTSADAPPSNGGTFPNGNHSRTDQQPLPQSATNGFH